MEGIFSDNYLKLNIPKLTTPENHLRTHSQHFPGRPSIFQLTKHNYPHHNYPPDNYSFYTCPYDNYPSNNYPLAN